MTDRGNGEPVKVKVCGDCGHCPTGARMAIHWMYVGMYRRSCSYAKVRLGEFVPQVKNDEIAGVHTKVRGLMTCVIGIAIADRAIGQYRILHG